MADDLAAASATTATEPGAAAVHAPRRRVPRLLGAGVAGGLVVAVTSVVAVVAHGDTSAGADDSPAAASSIVVASTWEGEHDVPIDPRVDHGATRLGGEAVDVARRVRDADERRHVVIVDDSTALDAVEAATTGIVRHRYDTAIDGFIADLTSADVARLERHPHVVAVEPTHDIAVTDTQVDPPWGLDRIDQRNRPLDRRYRPGGSGAGVDLYVFDSGLWLSHTDFAGRVAPGAFWDFGDGYGVWDCNGHGTHVAGTAGGTTHGVAKAVTLIPIRVTNCAGEGPAEALLGAVEWVLENRRSGRPAVANLSLGGPPSRAIDAAIDAMVDDGITVVVAAGNEASPTCGTSPARVPEAITVAASTSDDRDAPFSNYGSCNDLFAPGVGVLSAAPSGDDTGSALSSGTSMATPHVAGAAALVLERSPAATPAQVWSTIDAATTRGALSVCCDNPDKLLFTSAPTPSGPTPTTTPTREPPPTTRPTAISGFVAMSPTRVADTRAGTFTVDGAFAGDGRLEPGRPYRITIGDRAGLPSRPAAVAVTATVSSPGGPGHLTLWSCGVTKPNASTTNYNAAGQIVAATAIVKLEPDATLCAETHLADSDLVIDVVGYFPDAGGYLAVTPARLVDTRPGSTTIDGQQAGGGVVTATSTGRVQVTGRAGIDPGARAVTVNLTVTGTTGWGYATAHPCLDHAPATSSVNWTGAGQTVANAAIVGLDADGGFCVRVDGSDGHVLVDVLGAHHGDGFTPIGPDRVWDSRGGDPLASEEVRTVRLPTTDTATAAAVNVTVTDTTDWGFATVWPCGSRRPEASSLNWTGAGQTVANTTIAKLGTDRSICVAITGGTAHVIVDVFGITR